MKRLSSSAEKRERQGRQALLGLILLAIATLVAWLSESARPTCIGVLQGSLPPLLILMLRYVVRAITNRRIEIMTIVNAVGHTLAFGLILFFFFPNSLWEFGVIIIIFVATVFGLQTYKFTPFFMLLSSMLAGAILL